MNFRHPYRETDGDMRGYLCPLLKILPVGPVKIAETKRSDTHNRGGGNGRRQLHQSLPGREAPAQHKERRNEHQGPAVDGTRLAPAVIKKPLILLAPGEVNLLKQARDDRAPRIIVGACHGMKLSGRTKETRRGPVNWKYSSRLPPWG